MLPEIHMFDLIKHDKNQDDIKMNGEYVFKQVNQCSFQVIYTVGHAISQYMIQFNWD